MADKLTPRKEITQLKRIMAALKASYEAMLRKDLEPLRKRLAHLLAQKGRKRS